MKDTFEQAVADIIDREGGWDNNPHDHGGPTQTGITYEEFCVWQGIPRGEGYDPAIMKRMKALSRSDIARYYYDRCWRPLRCDDMPAGVDMVAVDSSLLFGIHEAVLFLQRAVGIAADGHIGSQTMAAVNAADPAAMVNHVCDQRDAHCNANVDRHPDQIIFLNGWLNRTRELRRSALKAISARDQDRLKDLGYQPGHPDGEEDALSRAATLSFQDQHGLPVTGDMDPLTRSSLHREDAKSFPVPEERASLTSDDLMDRGSTTVADARQDKAMARLGSTGALGFGLDQLFGGRVIDAVFSQVEKAESLFVRVGVSSGSPQFKRVLLAVAVIAACAYFWQRAHQREAERVAKARSGADRSR